MEEAIQTLQAANQLTLANDARNSEISEGTIPMVNYLDEQSGNVIVAKIVRGIDSSL